jgi:signal transduction histidine kinase
MGDIISKLERTIDRINILYGLIFPVSLMTIVAVATWVLTPYYFQPGSLPIYLFVIISVMIVFGVHFKHLNNLTKTRLQVMYSYYHFVLMLFCIFVAPYKSPYEALWILLAVGMDLVFKKGWMYITLLLYLITTIESFITTSQPLTLESYFNSSVYFIGVFSVSYLISLYRSISDEERHAISKTSEATNFERQRLLSLINNMGEAVVATDNKGKVLLYNAATLNLLDTNQSLEGKNIDMILKLKTRDHKKVKLFDKLSDTSSGITTSDYVHEFAPKDMINIYINAAPVKLGFKENQESGYIILMRDITKEKSLEDERDEFISVISHELRTPLAIAEGNLGNAIYITNKNESPRIVSDSLNEAHEQVIFLANMINDLATLSRAERTNVKLELKEIVLTDVIEEINLNYSRSAKDKNLKLAVTCASDTKNIVTSELYLKEILQNFVTNAIKYTAKGTVLIHARSNTKGEAVFSVSDTGIGLSKSDQKRVFEKFFRSEDYRTRESSGTGLGLYVTAKLAHLIHAQITLESELNKGTTFTITIPTLADNAT